VERNAAISVQAKMKKKLIRFYHFSLLILNNLIIRRFLVWDSMMMISFFIFSSVCCLEFSSSLCFSIIVLLMTFQQEIVFFYEIWQPIGIFGLNFWGYLNSFWFISKLTCLKIGLSTLIFPRTLMIFVWSISKETLRSFSNKLVDILFY